MLEVNFFFAELGVVFVNVYFEKFAFVVLYLMQLFPTQLRVSAVTETLADGPYQPWSAEVAFLEEITAEDDTLSRNVLSRLMQRDTEYSLCNMEDGVRQEGELISPMGNTEDLTDVGMEREDLGLMMSMYSEVSVLLMSLLKIFLVFPFLMAV